MKKAFVSLVLLWLTVAGANAEQPSTQVYIESDDVQLERISPAEPSSESEVDIKEREKRLRALDDKTAYMKASNSLKRGYFVLVADNVQVGNMGYRRYDINSNSNFVLVQQQDGIIQVAFNTGNPGANGLGGFTAKGKVTNQHLTTDNHGDVHLTYALNGSNVSAQVSITLYHGGKRAVAYVSPSMGGPRITIYGDILPYRDSAHRK